MNRKLFKSIREYKRESILAPVFVILEVLMEVLIPLQMAKIIDVGIQERRLVLYHHDGCRSGCHGNARPVFRRYGRKICGSCSGRICQKPAP